MPSGTPTHRMLLPSFGDGLPFSVNSFWKHYHRHTHRLVSMVIVNPVKLPVKINHGNGDDYIPNVTYQFGASTDGLKVMGVLIPFC